jgi:hypothetical protein
LTAGATTVGVYLEQWLAGARPSLKPSTAKSYREIVEWYVRPRVGHVKLADLNALHLRNLYANLLADGAMRREGGLSPSTVQPKPADHVVRLVLAEDAWQRLADAAARCELNVARYAGEVIEARAYNLGWRGQ